MSLLFRSVFRRFTHRSLQIQSIDSTHATLKIDGESIKYDWIFLRDACQCSQCLDPSTQQKRYRTTDIPLSIAPTTNGIQIVDANHLRIDWNEHHRSEFTADWLYKYSSASRIVQSRYDDRPMVFWKGKDLEKINLHISSDEYLHSDQGLARALHLLHDYGLVFLDQVQGEFAVEKLTERIGDIRQTFYGKSWDVKSVANAINVAYTSQALGLHMDLLYFEAPPGLQFLHCLENNVQGGASYFADSFLVADYLRREDPQSFAVLCRYPVTFHYRNAGRHYHRTRPTIVRDRTDPHRIDHVNYSPPFQAPFQSDTSTKDFREFLRAMKRFQELIEDDAHRYELVLRPGQCVIFHNRRILHARREFDASSGQRWLKGCYTDLDNFLDRYRICREREEKETERFNSK